MRARIGAVTLGTRPVIVAAGGQREIDALAHAAAADVVELRADRFDAPTPATIVAALERLATGGRPIILTARHASEGGGAMPDDLRLAILRAAAPHADALDVEIAGPAFIEAVRPTLAATGGTLILSAHAFDGTPPAATLQDTIDRGRALGGDVVKIAATTHSARDLRTLLEVTLANRAAGIVTLGMGPWGPLSRIVLPAAGSWLTYASVGEPTAPGQMPLDELASLVDRLYVG